MRKTVSILLNGVVALAIALVIVVTLINIGVITHGGEYTFLGG